MLLARALEAVAEIMLAGRTPASNTAPCRIGALPEIHFTAARKASDSFCNFWLIFFASALLSIYRFAVAVVAAINFPSVK